jgi:hypothetical protein
VSRLGSDAAGSQHPPPNARRARGRPRKPKPELRDPLDEIAELIARSCKGEYIPPPLTGKRGRPRTRADDAQKINARFHQLISGGMEPRQACRLICIETEKRLSARKRSTAESKLSLDYVIRQVKYWDRIIMERVLDPDLAYEAWRERQIEEEHEREEHAAAMTTQLRGRNAAD